MLEIIVLTVLVGGIGNMARRRGRSPFLFGTALVVCWFVGQALGAVVGVSFAAFPSSGASGGLDGLLVYGTALAGACVGVTLAFSGAKLLQPVGGQWRELLAGPVVPSSRLKGAVVGGVGGAVIGVVLLGGMFFGDGEPIDSDGVSAVILGILTISCIGSLLGLISGVNKKK